MSVSLNTFTLARHVPASEQSSSTLRVDFNLLTLLFNFCSMTCSSQLHQRQTLILAAGYVAIGTAVTVFSSLTLPYSSWYTNGDVHELYNNVLTVNAQRGREASDYIQSSNFSGLFSRLQTTQHPELCFVVVSVRRPVQGTLYLTQVVARLAPQVLKEENTTLMVYNAGGDKHLEALELSKHVPVVSSEQESIPNADRERLDYIGSLQVCLNQQAKYAVVIEDDALPARDFISRLKFVLQHRVARSGDSWAFLRLFYPEKYQGWGNDPKIVVELIGSVILIATLLTCLSVIVLRPTHYSGTFSKWTLYVRFSLSCVLSLYILRTVGRPHLLEVRKVSAHFTSVIEAPGCCTPGVVYPRIHLQEVISYLQSVHCNKKDYPVDIALDDFAQTRGLHRWLAVPNMMTHIGIISSLPHMGLKTTSEMAFLLERNP